MDQDETWLLVGLGNPGRQYAGNRHNVGFMVVEAWADVCGAGAWREKFNGRFTTVTRSEGRVVVVEPLTFMNRSGGCVGPAANFFGVHPEHVVVVHDEIDFELGRIAVKQGGGHGGHNGLRDIISVLGTADFVRVRTGVGRPEHGDVAAWVLSDFTATERAIEVPELLVQARGAVTAVIGEGVAAAMRTYNAQSRKPAARRG